MMIIRYRDHHGIAIGVSDGPSVFPLTGDMASLLRLSRSELRSRLDHQRRTVEPIDRESVTLLAPIDRLTEVWAAGVTYKASKSARMEESDLSADVYERVYEAERPELFFKSVAWRVVGDGADIRARSDSSVDVPEAELALVINSHREVIGYSVCNDMSSRSIEGDNPLYLPQAKIYQGSCAIGPGITPFWEIDRPDDLTIGLSIRRDGALAWDGATSTSQLHRRLDELVDWLHRELDFPDGVWLSTGTSLVPALPFTLTNGDVVEIAIESVGTLTNTVCR